MQKKNFLYMDYFATGEGRTVLLLYVPDANEQGLTIQAEKKLNTNFYTQGFEFYNIEEIKKLSENHPMKLFMREETPLFYKKICSKKNKYNEPFEYYSHVNLS